LARRLLEETDRASLTRRERVELAISSALIALDHDDDRAAGDLEEALALARPERLVRTIIDLGPGLNGLFALLPQERGQDDYLQCLAFGAEANIVPSATVPLTLLRDPLTEREQVVLRYLSSRLTYKEIASLLYVSLNTLKSHVRAVYRKLEVDARPEAIRVARALDLL
jgi:LuxR family maltose regulon positive regulatory protein